MQDSTAQHLFSVVDPGGKRKTLAEIMLGIERRLAAIEARLPAHAGDKEAKQ
jgi:hypothetical protein